MSDFRTAHAIPIMCVGMMIMALCMVAYATLAPDNSIRVFLFAFAFVLFVVSFNKMLSVAWYEKNLSRLHDELSHVSPDTCPDYWQAGFDKCHGHKCKPYFKGNSAEGEEGTVWMMGNAEEDAEIRLRDYQTMSADSLCNLNRQYPWMELSNECAAHNRTL